MKNQQYNSLVLRETVAANKYNQNGTTDMQSKTVEIFEQMIDDKRDEYLGYDSVALYFAESLEEAWAQACPDETSRFLKAALDADCAKSILDAGGMWLPLKAEQGYAVLLITEGRSAEEIAFTLRKGIRACLNHRDHNITGEENLTIQSLLLP